nr:hypothetical protein [Tanacetum cinerariifolium]
MLNDKHAMCVLNSVANPIKKIVASKYNQKPRNITRKLYERVSKTCSWWYPKFTPSGYNWKPKSGKENVNPNLVEIVLFIVDSRCSKQMIGDLKLLINFVEKFLGTVKFGNDQIAPILGYGDLGNDLLTGSHGTDLYSITLKDTNSPNPICLMAKATSSQAWLWHRRLSYLNFDTINLLSKNDIMRTTLEHDSLSPGTQCQANVTQADMTITTSNELDLLFSLMFDELLNGSSKVLSKSFAVTTVDPPNHRQQQNTTPLNNHITPVPTCQVPSHAPTIASNENMNQAEMVKEYAQVENYEFINIFCTPVQDRGDTSSRHVNSSNMHTFYQHHLSEHRWTKDHPLEQVIGNPSQSVRTRRHLESDGEMCMFALTVSRTELKNIKEAMADSAWIESLLGELHQFYRLDVWELVDRPLCKNV